MAMTISSSPKYTAPAARPQASSGDTPTIDSKKLVDRIVDNTYLGANYTASGLSGMAAGVGAFVRSAPGATLKTGVSVYSNLWKAETVGPNLKILGSLVAAPVILGAAALGLPVSLGNGLYQGADEVDSSKPRQFTIGAAAQEGYSTTRSGWEDLTKSITEGMAEFGAKKLEAGEKPIDIPIIKTAKTLAVGAAAAAVGGVAGLVSAVVATGREIAVGVAQAFGDESLNIGGKLLAAGGAVIGGAVHGVTYGATTALSVTGHGFAKTWDKDSMIEGTRHVFQQAASSVAAAAAPESTLLREKKA